MDRLPHLDLEARVAIQPDRWEVLEGSQRGSQSEKVMPVNGSEVENVAIAIETTNRVFIGRRCTST